MQTGEIIVIAAVAVMCIAGAVVTALIVSSLRKSVAYEVEKGRRDTTEALQNSINQLSNTLTQAQRGTAEQQSARLSDLRESLSRSQESLTKSTRESLDALDSRLRSFAEQNDKKLEEMRQTVDEKLQKTLDDRLSNSFKQVSDHLEQVNKGLGEMRELAGGVGDLKKVLSNVKTRGVLGEMQLRAILEEILSPGQYETNVAVKPGSGERVEFAIRLPADGGVPVYMPIDSKFPGDVYSNLRDAYDSDDPDRIKEAAAALQTAIKKCAKDIRDKYICPPHTTEFAIMFLPFEGLYAEVASRGMIELLQREYQVNIAGPSTMAALLNSLQMGFKTLAIQKRSSEVWNVLRGVKDEFGKFAKELETAKSRVESAGKTLDTLIGTRTNMMNRRLREVEALPAEDSALPDISDETDSLPETGDE